MKQKVKTEHISGIEKESLQLLETVRNTERELEELYPLMHDEISHDMLEEKADSIKRANSNMRKALMQGYRISDEFNSRWKDIKKQKKRAKFHIPTFANATIDINEIETDSFAKGINIYKILLILFIGSFFGVVLETLWCFVQRGYIESRAGLVYGPFNLLYGAGAALLTLCLYKYRNRNGWLIFIGGFVCGSVLEYVCSFGQELIFGSTSWDYSGKPFNIDGRICLMYSLAWGFIGVFWMKTLYPIIAKWIMKIPNRIGKQVTWAVTAFLIFNSCVTLVAVNRWSERIEGVEAENGFEMFIDRHFTDERLERIFANMEFDD